MDILTATIYIILFILLMIFVFSMGLSTPLIEKKGLISVVIIGFVIGIVGGGFFISPIYDDLPYIAGTLQQIVSGSEERINIEVSTKMNVTSLIKELKEVDGIHNITSNGVIVKTDPFSDERKQNIEDKLQILDENFKSYEIDTDGEIRLKIPPTYDPSKAISTLSDWLMYTGEINTKYAVIQLQLRVEASKLEEIQEYLNSRHIVSSSVEGPVQDTIENTKEAMPNNSILIFILGLVGILVALLGVFFDDIIKFIREFIKNIKNK